MKTKTPHTRYAALGMALAITAGGAVVMSDNADAAGARPGFKAPFTCGTTWRGSAWTTYNGHNHNPMRSVDWNMGSGNDDKGRLVRASAAGIVEHAGPVSSGYGTMVVVRHYKSGWKTRYAHLLVGSLNVKKGDNIKQGKIIGKVGQSGGQPSAHLHYEQIRDGDVVNSVIQGQKFYPNDVKYIKSTNGCSS